MNEEKFPPFGPEGTKPDSGWLTNANGGPVSNEDIASQPDTDDIFALDASDLSSGPASFAGKLPPQEDSAIPLYDLPQIRPTAPESAWLDSQVGLPKMPSELRHIPTSSSDILFVEPPRGGSDVIGGLVGEAANKSSSSIFHAPPAGSSRFANPTEPTEEHLDDPLPDYNLFDNNVDSDQQLTGELNAESAAVAELFRTPMPPKQLGDSNGAKDGNLDGFDELSKEPSSSNLFDDATGLPEEDEGDYAVIGSGVNLANPYEGPDPLAGPSSSIFAGDVASEIHKENVELDHIPIMASNDEASDAMRFTLEQDENNSSIFQSKKTRHSDPESVFDDAVVADALAEAEATAGAIDWQLPESLNEQVSQRMAVDSVEPSEDPVDYFSASANDNGKPNANGLMETDWDALAGEPSPSFGQDTQDAFKRDELSEDKPAPSKKLNSTAGIPFRATPGLEEVTPAKPAKNSRSVAEFEVEEKPTVSKKGGSLGWIAGSALGLVLGVGGSTGVFLSGALNGPETAKPIVGLTNIPAPRPEPEIQPAPPVDPRTMLAAGEPAKALAALEKLGDSAPTSARADRGQARWLTRLREASANPADITADDEQFKKAEQDLQAVVNESDKLKTDEDKQAGVRAALHLGLMKEVTGDFAAATRIYTDASTKFPGSAQVFKTALERLKLTKPANKQQSRMQNREALELAQAAIVMLTMIQEDAKKNSADQEPGFLYWEASNLAASGQFDEAMKQLSTAKKLHEQRRLAFAGKGTNPLSDPLEQIFTRNCDDLAELWKLKKELYSHPKYGTAIAKQGAGTVLTELDNKNTALATEKSSAEKEAIKLKEQFEKDSLSTKEMLAKTDEDRKKALSDLEKVKADLNTVQDKVALADLQFKKADATLNSMIKELKVNKLVDEQDDLNTVLKKLPTVLKEASAASASADVKKAAEALLLAKKERDAALNQAKEAMIQADKAQEVAKQAMANLEKARQDSEAQIKLVKESVTEEIKKAVTLAQAENLKKVDELTTAANKARTELANQQREFQTRVERLQADLGTKLAAKDAELVQRLQQKDQQYQQAISDVRAGAAVPLSSAELLARDRAAQAYGRGVDFYFTNQFIAAEASFALAASLDQHDARYWYFLGLSRTMLGRADAEASFRKGADQERRSQPSSQAIDDSLERVQGSVRQTLSGYRPR
jgi:hypothetical protein